MSSKDALKSEILKKAVVHGKVILSSGKEADYYVDLRRVTLDATAAPLVGEVMLELTKDLDFEAVGGLTLGADPVATAMMHVAASQGKKIDSFVVRKAEKAHGLQRRIEGPDVKGRRVVAVEDTSTTGGSVLTAVEALKEAGAIVVGVAVIVERGAKGKVEEAGAYHIEALTKDGKVSFFLLDGKAKAMSNKGVTGSVLFQFADGDSKTVLLSASGTEGFDAKDAEAATYTKAIVTFKVKGKTVSTKFSTTAKKEAHHHEEGELASSVADLDHTG